MWPGKTRWSGRLVRELSCGKCSKSRATTQGSTIWADWEGTPRAKSQRWGTAWLHICLERPVHANHRGKEEGRRRRKSDQVTPGLSLGQRGWILLRAPWGSLKGYEQKAARSD